MEVIISHYSNRSPAHYDIVGDEVFKAAIEAELVPKKIGEGSLGTSDSS